MNWHGVTIPGVMIEACPNAIELGEAKKASENYAGIDYVCSVAIDRRSAFQPNMTGNRQPDE